MSIHRLHMRLFPAFCLGKALNGNVKHFVFDLTCDVTGILEVKFLNFIWKISSRPFHCRLNFSPTSVGFRDRWGPIRPPPPPAEGRVRTRALLGGRLNAPPPPTGFTRIVRKRRRAAPPGFHLPYPPSFWQLLRNFRSWVMQGKVTRSGQVTTPYKKFTIAPQVQCLRESYETFGIWWGHQCLQNVYLGFLISVTSGQVIFATSPL